MPKYKHNSPKKYDVEKELDKQAKFIARIRKADAAKRKTAVAKKKKGTWVSRLKKNVQSVVTGPGHSPAGKKHLRKGY